MAAKKPPVVYRSEKFRRKALQAKVIRTTLVAAGLVLALLLAYRMVMPRSNMPSAPGTVSGIAPGSKAGPALQVAGEIRFVDGRRIDILDQAGKSVCAYPGLKMWLQIADSKEEVPLGEMALTPESRFSTNIDIGGQALPVQVCLRAAMPGYQDFKSDPVEIKDSGATLDNLVIVMRPREPE